MSEALELEHLASKDAAASPRPRAGWEAFSKTLRGISIKLALVGGYALAIGWNAFLLVAMYTLNNLGVSYLLSGDYERSAEALQDAVALGSDDPAVHNNLGLALGLLGRNADSFKTFRASGSVGDAYNNLGYVFFLRGDYDAAIRSYEKALLSDDTDMRRVIRNIYRAESSRDRARQAHSLEGTRPPPEP